MHPRFSFLVTYYAHPELLRACLDSIRRFHPEAPIVISQQAGDDPIPDALKPFTRISHDMSANRWAAAAQGLMKACPTDIGVFLEHDCVLLKPADDLVAKLGAYNLIGVEEVIEKLRHSPGFAAQSFFILDVKRFLESYGIEAVCVSNPEALGQLKNVESAYGITQHSERILFLPVIRSGYAWGTYYGDQVHHLWYGSYRKRLAEEYGGWLEHETKRFLADYEAGLIGHGI